MWSLQTWPASNRGVGYLYLDTAGSIKCSRGSQTLAKSVLHLYQNYLAHAKVAAKTRIPMQLRLRDRFAAGSTTALPLLARHSCQATSIGAAIAIEE